SVLTVGMAFFSYERWKEAKALKNIYAERLLELRDAPYHAISFADRREAAAFVAALGRQLHAPGHDLNSYEEDVEISATSSKDSTTLYLSEGALRAFSDTFTAPPHMQQVQGRSLPWDRVAVLV